jgi:hypothetical protein
VGKDSNPFCVNDLSLSHVDIINTSTFYFIKKKKTGGVDKKKEHESSSQSAHTHSSS